MSFVIIPPIVEFIAPPSPPITIGLVPAPSVSNSTDILIYAGGGGTLFPSLPFDNILGSTAETPVLFHGGNPLLTDAIQIPAYDKLNITVNKKDIFSTENQKGIFNINYPSPGLVDGKIEYIWSDIYTSPLGIYTNQTLGSLSGLGAVYNFNITNEILTIFTNDVNTIPRIGDYIVFNQIINWPLGYTNGVLPQNLPYIKGNETYIAKILDVSLVSGLGINVKYSLKLDKSFNFQLSSKFAIILLNRSNSGINKELFYETFEQIEINRQQLLGDPYNNTTLTSLPLGRKNYLNYNGINSLGMQNLLSGIINNNNTPFIVFDANDDIQDRISYSNNIYDSLTNYPVDIHFEFHLPYIMINENLFPGTFPSPVDSSGNVLENIFVTNSNIFNDSNIGRYNGLYLKNDTTFSNRYGWVFFDLRIVIIDNAELVTALSYNSNRNYTLPTPNFLPGIGNELVNTGVGINLNITNISSVSYSGLIVTVVTVSTPYNLPRGTRVFITGVSGSTSANGDHFITEYFASPTDIYKFELWDIMPTYSYIGGVLTRNYSAAIPVIFSTSFIFSGIGNSGIIQGGLPAYSYFYTYRFRNIKNNSVMPYATPIPFNWAIGGNIDNTNGLLSIYIPKLNWHNSQPTLLSNNLGFETMGINDSANVFGLDIIIGKYLTDLTDLVNPTAIIGLSDIMCLKVASLTNVVSGITAYSLANNPINGFNINIIKQTDYDAAITSSLTYPLTVNDFTFDLVNNMPLYSYSTGSMSSTLLTGNGKWTLGNFIYRNHVEMNRAKFSITVPASSWNGSTNPTYTPSTNSFIVDKYITEVAIIVPTDSIGNEDLTPMIYTKVSPPIKKNQILDLNFTLSIDF